MHKGVVRWFSEARGYGFIRPDDESREILVHFSGIETRGFKTLSPGQRVGFEVRQDQKGGQRACRVIPLALTVAIDSFAGMSS
jgi:CspA family cold shock protein